MAYWQATAQQLLSDPATPDGSDARKSYGHLAQAQANLLASHSFNDQAEQAYRTASTLWPDSVELLGDYSGFLAGAGRLEEAKRLIDNYVQSYPTNRAAVDKLRQTVVVQFGGARLPASRWSSESFGFRLARTLAPPTFWLNCATTRQTLPSKPRH